jgi:transposase InsO family protein
MTARRQPRIYDRWAQLRFSVIGQLLADPPVKGTLQSEIRKLSLREWRHPATGEPVRFGGSTIQRWYYKALRERTDPVSVLRRKPRQDAGHQESMTAALRQALRTQHAAHPNWSAQLHHDNLVAEASNHAELGLVPSYSTIRRYLKAQGLEKRRRVTSRRTAGALVAEAKLAEREIRGYEAEYCGSLLHWDCHFAARKVLTPRGEWQTPVLFGVLDDHSRLVCHLQWYLTESAQNIAHGLSQAFMKRGLPRAAMSDNGAAMTATEIAEGLLRLGVLHETTLPYSPFQNGKLEHLWAVVEARLMAMLEGVADLTLAMLNEATLAWVEPDYNRKRHSEIGEAPLGRFLRGPSVMRPCPDSAVLKRAFTRTEQRTQRKSDGTITIDARRFEVPNQYRHLSRLEVRYAAWDLTEVHLVDERLGQVLCRLFPQDKARNADGLRRSLNQASAEPVAAAPASGVAPLLARLIERQTASGLPPAYLPKDEGDDA